MKLTPADEKALVAALFQTETGKKVLELFTQKFKDCTIADPSKTHEQAYYNEGRRSVVKFINNSITDASKPIVKQK